MDDSPLVAGGASVQEDSDFSWEEYLEEHGALAVPHCAFKHVDQSLQTGLTPGMKLEVPLRDTADTYWVATIVTTCGQLLLLRYEGFQDDRRADFWCDIMTADLHPIGWGRQQGRPMKPPEGVRDKHEHWETLLENVLSEACSAPANLLEGPHRGKNPLDLLAPGASVELRDPADATAAWGATIEENVGGRLCLRYAGTEGLSPACGRIWLFYLHPLLRPPGWASQHGCTVTPPAVLRPLRTDAEWDEVRQQISSRIHDGTLAKQLRLEDQTAVSVHCFAEGMKLEAVDPVAPFHICPATVTKVFDNVHFLVEMDDLRRNINGRGGGTSILCHRGSAGILPVQWTLKNGVQLTPPAGYQGQDFDWADYLKLCRAEAAPQHCFPTETSVHSFKESMKLEAVNPLSPDHIHVATITKVRGQYIWLNLEGLKQSLPDLIVHVDSMDIFPVSWCETNGYPLQHSRKPKAPGQSRVAVVHPEKLRDPPKCSNVPKQQANSQSEHGQNHGKYSCPKIYFNHLCFSGPYLNKGRIAELPQSVGPGSCVLVLKEVLTLLINAAYKPSQVLRELQLDEGTKWQGHRETLKAKYRGKSYRATVQVVRTADQVAEFCRQICKKLECCPNLFGPLVVLEHCSENCATLTKTKYPHCGKKSKHSGRPPGGAVRRSGRRRKLKRCSAQKKRRTSASLDSSPGDTPQDSGEEEELDEEDPLSEDSSSELLDESEWKSQPASPSSAETPPSRRGRRKACSPSCSDDENRPPSAKGSRVGAPQRLCLDSSPLEWSVADVARFIRTTDCAPLARIFADQEIDGQALLLLTLSTVQECMDLKLGLAVRLCHHVERVKLAFYQQYAN